MEKELVYEDAIKELEEITNKLESESLPLGKSEELFSLFLTLAKFCQKELSKTSKKLFEIKKELDNIEEESK